MKWLWTSRALEVHAVFLLAVALLACSVLTGDDGPAGDYPQGLVFCGIAYPAALFLLRAQWRINGKGES